MTQQKLKIEESALFPDESDSYWQSTIINEENFPVSAGFHCDKLYARKVALAELIERQSASAVYLESPEKWGFETISTLCGFAAGFDEYNTRLRSLKEGLERWVMSLWIDDGYYIEEVGQPEDLPKSCLFLIEPFDEVLFYFRKVTVLLDNKLIEVPVAQTFGLKGKGIYPGSSTQDTGNGIFEHALVESYRHYMGVKNNPKRGDIFPDNKVYYFSENKDVALRQMRSATNKAWPTPKIKLHKAIALYEGRAFLARTIIDGWTSWEKGPLERFLY